MPSFPKPSFEFNYHASHEVEALREYRETKPGRQIPPKRSDRLLLATWNIANLGLHERDDRDYRLMAEIISWFDLVALQEIHDNLEGLRTILEHLGDPWETVFSDKAGNEERLAFVFDGSKVETLEMFAEIAIPPSENKWIGLPGVDREFGGFDRNPFLASFEAGSLRFILIDVHLYFGDDDTADRERRALEAYAVSRWADLRHDDQHAYARNILALGDFNIPKVEPGDPIYDALRKRGLRRPEHSTQIASNIAGDKNYDQILFLPGPTKDAFTGNHGIFDFDGAVFSGIWEDEDRSEAQFRSFVRYHLSDHRPLWAEFAI